MEVKHDWNSIAVFGQERREHLRVKYNRKNLTENSSYAFTRLVLRSDVLSKRLNSLICPSAFESSTLYVSP
jgi:hypothetical protein